MGEARLLINGELRRTVAPGDPVRFGRFHQPGIVGLSTADDTSISSDQGEIGWEGNALVLTNRSTKVPLSVEYRDVVLHVAVPAGGRHVFTDHALVIAPSRRWIAACGLACSGYSCKACCNGCIAMPCAVAASCTRT